jgi:membrane fusion protein (multidrug efflux system)
MVARPGSIETSFCLGHLNGKGKVTSMTQTYVYPSIRSFTPLMALLAGAAISSGCSRAAGQTRSLAEAVPVLDVKLATASDIKVPRVLTLSGTLTGNEQAKVAAGAAGKVIATFVERGQVVKKGAVLVQLDPRAVRAQAQEAAAQFESLKAQQTQAELDCARTQRMFDKGAIAKAEYDRAHTQCETTKWSESAAEARKTLTAEALHDTQIRAPFDGLVVERHVTAGEYVRVDSPVVSLVDVDALRVELTVPEADLVQVQKDMTVEFRTAAGERGRAYRGKIRYIGPSVRQQTRDAVVEAVVENGTHELRPGMFVTAKLELGQQMLPSVPETAVLVEGTQRHVFVSVGGRLEDRLVQIAEARSGLVPVVDGLKSGDRVVAQLTPDIRDGARVK